jgi:hypothetical protein
MVPAAGALDCGDGGTIRGGGALYTGRGPVCGTIIRGAGGCGGPMTTGGAGRAAGACVCGTEDAAEGAAKEAVAGGAAGVCDGACDGACDGTITAGGGGTGRGPARGGAATTDGAAAAGFSVIEGPAAGATVTEGCACGATGAGVTAEGIAGVTGGAAGLATGGTATGRAATGGAAGRAEGATASFCWVIAFSTSPGREMFDRSILVLISSSPRSGRAVFALGDCASDEPRR